MNGALFYRVYLGAKIFKITRLTIKVLIFMIKKTEEKGALTWIVNGCGFVCEISLVALVLMVGFEVLSRNLFGLSFSGVEILSGYVLVMLTFLGGSVALRAGSVYRMQFVEGNFHPFLASILAILVHLVAIIFLSLIVYYSSKLVLSSFARGVTSQANASIKLWWLQVVIPVGCSTMIMILISGLIKKSQLVKARLLSKRRPGEDTQT